MKSNNNIERQNEEDYFDQVFHSGFDQEVKVVLRQGHKVRRGHLKLIFLIINTNQTKHGWMKWLATSDQIIYHWNYKDYLLTIGPWSKIFFIKLFNLQYTNDAKCTNRHKQNLLQIYMFVYSTKWWNRVSQCMSSLILWITFRELSRLMRTLGIMPSNKCISTSTYPVIATFMCFLGYTLGNFIKFEGGNKSGGKF